MLFTRMKLYRYCLPLLVMAVALGLTGCDSGVAPTQSTGDAQTTVQFAASGAAVTESDGSASIDLTITNPDGSEVSVDVIFAAPASEADTDDFSVEGGSLSPISGSDAFFVATVTFPASAEDGATQSLTITDLSDDDPTEPRESAIFALQDIETSGSAQIGEPSSFDLSIGFPTIAEARETPLGNNLTVQGTVIRIDGGTSFVQDESGGIAVFDDPFSEGVSIGDRVVVGGTMDVFAGLLEIVDVGEDGFTVLSSGNEVEPTTATLAELADNGESFEATLVRVEGMTFEDSGTFQGGTNYTISDGSGGAVQLRVTSNSFYTGQPIPSGEVTFEGVMSQFNGNFGGIEPNTGYQLLALNEGDISGGDTGGGGGPSLVTINEARQSQGTEVQFEGTVTRAFGDYARVQDNSGPTGASALVIRQTGGANAEDFSSDISDGTIQPGTTIQITGVISAFNGLVQVNDDDLTSYQVMSQGSAPDPQSVTLGDLESNGEDYESELVEITDLTFTEASGTFENGTNYDVSDGSTTLTLRVQNDNESNLGGESIPENTFTYTGVTGEFNESYQLIPVRPGDLEASGNGGGPNVITIDAARQESNGTSVTVEGILTRKDGQNAYIQDDSGPTGASGIVVRDGDLADAIDGGSVAIGDRIQATGELGAFNGLIQISSNVSYSIVAEDVGLPAFQTVTVDELNANGEDYESELVEVTDLSIDPDGGDDDSNPDGEFKGGGGEGNYEVTGPNDNTIILRIPSSSFYVGEPIPEDPVTFTGVLGQFNGAGFGERDPDEGYQLTALNDGDITVQ